MFSHKKDFFLLCLTQLSEAFLNQYDYQRLTFVRKKKSVFVKYSIKFFKAR